MEDHEKLNELCDRLIKAGYSTGPADSFAELAEECVLNLEELENPWVDVNERLPENNSPVFVRRETTFGDFDFTTARYNSDYKREDKWSSGPITHWMPIPPFPHYLPHDC